MRIILAGQRRFGLEVLHNLVREEHKVVGVITPHGDPIEYAAPMHALRIAEGPTMHQWVADLGADVIVAAHSHAFLGRKTRAATRLGALGYHPSLLPRHRGRDAVRWTIAMRDPIAGGSVYWFTDNVDGGPIAAQGWCHVDPTWTASDLWRERLFPMGIGLLERALRDLRQGVVVAEPQDERFATWEPSWERAPLFRPELPELGGPAGFEVRGRVER